MVNIVRNGHGRRIKMRLIDDETLMIEFYNLYKKNDDIVKKQNGCLWLSLETIEQIIKAQPEAHDSECIPISWIKRHRRFPKDEHRARVLNDMIESWYAEEWGDYWGD